MGTSRYLWSVPKMRPHRRSVPPTRLHHTPARSGPNWTLPHGLPVHVRITLGPFRDPPTYSKMELGGRPVPRFVPRPFHERSRACAIAREEDSTHSIMVIMDPHAPVGYPRTYSKVELRGPSVAGPPDPS